MKNALNNQVGMLVFMFLWLVADLKQGFIYFIKQALPPNISAGSVSTLTKYHREAVGLQIIFIVQITLIHKIGLWLQSTEAV